MYVKSNKPQVTAQSADGQVVVVDTATGAYYHLNETASALWPMIDAGCSVEQLTEALAPTAGESADQVRGDVESLVEQLQGDNLVVPAGQAGDVDAAAVSLRGPYQPPTARGYRHSPQDRLQIVGPNIAGKVIDDEAIVININTGAYFSLDGVGAAVWTLIETGCNIQQMVTAISEAWDVSPRRVRGDLERLIDQMIETDLVNVVGCEPPPAPAPLADPQRDYATPELNIYRDMEDLLALDPPLPEAEDTQQQADVNPPAPQRDATLGDVDWKR